MTNSSSFGKDTSGIYIDSKISTTGTRSTSSWAAFATRENAIPMLYAEGRQILQYGPGNTARNRIGRRHQSLRLVTASRRGKALKKDHMIDFFPLTAPAGVEDCEHPFSSPSNPIVPA